MLDATSHNRSLVVRVVEATAWLGESPRVIFSVTAASVAAIGVLDAMTAPALRPTLLDVLPIVYVTWFAETRAGLVTAAVCAMSAYAIDLVVLAGSPARTSVASWNALIDFTVFMIVVAVASLKHAFGQQRALAREDPLTGMANRRLFVEEAEREIARSRRYHRPFTVALVDLDGFKRINDTHGHQAGDEILKRVTDRIRASVRATDIPARLGGDEFALLLPETDYEAAQGALEKIRSSIGDDGSSPCVTASIGAITFDIPPSSVNEILISADVVMYAVKERPGKNAVMVARASDCLESAAALVRR